MEALAYIVIGIVIASVVVVLRRRFAAFYGQKPEDYEDSFPILDMRKHLNGPMICEGVIFGPLGRVTSSFVADFDITWTDDVAIMSERFSYNDGSVQERAWRIVLEDDGKFTTTAEDVPGRGLGIVTGSTIFMRYKIRLPETSGGHVLDTVDWMYLTPDGSLMNRSQFRKFGFKVAELVATIRPKEMT